ncbi:MAG: hypothetical protein NVS9B11_12490 [Candidatus Dormibacteraceae bacterium]
MFDLSGRVAVITGASRGLGRQDALTLARQGADVVITDVLVEDDPDLQKTAEAQGSMLAQVAVSQGWVDMAVAPDEFQGAVAALAGRLAKAATFAIAMIKDAVQRGYDLPLDEAMEIEARNFARAALSTDAAIGIMSFLSKQEPEYTGS